jgi:myo-inositol-1(or 4)-monophosphatase
MSEELLGLAEAIAREAGARLRDAFAALAEDAPAVSAKSTPTDLVSEVDVAVENLIRERLHAARPADAILGEEGADVEGTSGVRWVVDPLDGTVNFLYGHAAWAVSIALEDAEGRAVGVVHDPARGETFRAFRGGGCELNGKPVRVSGADRLDVALVATGFGYAAERRALQAEALARVLPRVRDIRRNGSAALDLAWVAAGRLDGYYERGVQHWDTAAGRLLVEEAGGATAELPGEPAGLAAAAPALLPKLVELVG